MFRGFMLGAATAVALAAATPAHAVIELQWWHAMTGGNNDVIVKLANDFNASQSEYKVVPTYKGSYADTMNAGIAAFRAGNAPHIMQVFEVGTATMMAATGAVKPVSRADEGGRREVRLRTTISRRITGYYSTAKGEMLSLPFNSSSTVMWINKDALKKAGLSPKIAEDLAGGVRRRQEAEGGRLRDLRLLQRLGHLGEPRAALGLAQRAALHQGERARRLRHRAEVQRPDLQVQAPAEPGRAAEGQDLRLLRPHQHRRRPLHLGRMPDLPHLVGLLRQREGERQVRLDQRADALLSGREGRAAELDHRRRLAVGDGRQEARRIQGRREVLHVPVRHRPPGRGAQGLGLSADHQGGLRQDQGVRATTRTSRISRRRCSN